MKSILLEANYIGNKSNHLEVTRNINALPAQYLSTLKTRDDVYNNLLTASIPNPMVGLVPGNSQGTYTGTTISRQTLLSPFPAFGANAINTHRQHRLRLVSQLPVHGLQALPEGLHRAGQLHTAEVDAGG